MLMDDAATWQDLEEMARTILYDFRDMSKQLKMLIILGKVGRGTSPHSPHHDHSSLTTP